MGYSKIETLPFPSGLSPLTQIEVNRLFKHTSFVKGELGTRIDRGISLIMPLRFVRQAVANNTAQSLVLFVKLGAQMLAAVAARDSVSELAHTVYMNALNMGLDFTFFCL